MAGPDPAAQVGEAPSGEKPRAERAPAATSEATRHSMQANKSKDTKPELRVRAALRAAGLRGYRLHYKRVPGKPDICFVGKKVAIFVHGCYWHRCPYCALPTPRSHTDFWTAKFARNRARDARDNALLVQAGWTVVVIWECRLKKTRFDATMAEVVELVRQAGEKPRRPRQPGRVVEVGATGGWRLRRRRARLRR